jgi:hypothetical protein
MRDGFIHFKGQPQAMVFPENHPDHSLRGQPKGAEIFLRERGLWPGNGKRSDGLRFSLECSKSGGREGCRLSDIQSWLLIVVHKMRGGGGDGLAVKYVGTTCLRAAGSSPAPPTVWVFWHLIWRTESLDRGLILVRRFSFVSSRVCIPVVA